ncbi:MAG: bifunctional DNA primase/polymerase [Ancalomicrobiaceae bacterium]|nr:bifunctional DNA primase/polymerase [Ancalomicrobiaceae bacterium]
MVACPDFRQVFDLGYHPLPTYPVEFIPYRETSYDQAGKAPCQFGRPKGTSPDGEAIYPDIARPSALPKWQDVYAVRQRYDEAFWRNAERAIDNLHDRYPSGYNMGVLTGTPAGEGYVLTAIDDDREYDSDPDHPMFRQLDAMMKGAPVKLGRRGATWFVRCEKGTVINRNLPYRKRPEDPADWPDGGKLQILGAGQQTVIPPSIHPKTRAPYRWVRELVPVDQLPILDTYELLTALFALGFTSKETTGTDSEDVAVAQQAWADAEDIEYEDALEDIRRHAPDLAAYIKELELQEEQEGLDHSTTRARLAKRVIFSPKLSLAHFKALMLGWPYAFRGEQGPEYASSFEGQRQAWRAWAHALTAFKQRMSQGLAVAVELDDDEAAGGLDGGTPAPDVTAAVATEGTVPRPAGREAYLARLERLGFEWDGVELRPGPGLFDEEEPYDDTSDGAVDGDDEGPVPDAVSLQRGLERPELITSAEADGRVDATVDRAASPNGRARRFVLEAVGYDPSAALLSGVPRLVEHGRSVAILVKSAERARNIADALGKAGVDAVSLPAPRSVCQFATPYGPEDKGIPLEKAEGLLDGEAVTMRVWLNAGGRAETFCRSRKLVGKELVGVRVEIGGKKVDVCPYWNSCAFRMAVPTAKAADVVVMCGSSSLIVNRPESRADGKVFDVTIALDVDKDWALANAEYRDAPVLSELSDLPSWKLLPEDKQAALRDIVDQLERTPLENTAVILQQAIGAGWTDWNATKALDILHEAEIDLQRVAEARGLILEWNRRLKKMGAFVRPIAAAFRAASYRVPGDDMLAVVNIDDDMDSPEATLPIVGRKKALNVRGDDVIRLTWRGDIPKIFGSGTVIMSGGLGTAELARRVFRAAYGRAGARVPAPEIEVIRFTVQQPRDSFVLAGVIGRGSLRGTVRSGRPTEAGSKRDAGDDPRLPARVAALVGEFRAGGRRAGLLATREFGVAVERLTKAGGLARTMAPDAAAVFGDGCGADRFQGVNVLLVVGYPLAEVRDLAEAAQLMLEQPVEQGRYAREVVTVRLRDGRTLERGERLVHPDETVRLLQANVDAGLASVVAGLPSDCQVIYLGVAPVDATEVLPFACSREAGFQLASAVLARGILPVVDADEVAALERDLKGGVVSGESTFVRALQALVRDRQNAPAKAMLGQDPEGARTLLRMAAVGTGAGRRVVEVAKSGCSRIRYSVPAELPDETLIEMLGGRWRVRKAK